jgi:mRNA interferase MazF
VWLADLGIAAKIRSGLVLSVPPEAQDRVLVTLVRHTTSVQGTRFEVAVAKPFLKPGRRGAGQAGQGHSRNPCRAKRECPCPPL